MPLEELQSDLDAWLERYNHHRPHQEKRCQGRTPMETFLENLPAAREKIIDRQESQLTVVG